MQEQDQIYKVELIEEHADKGEAISFYKQGEFTDLCAGPHLMATGNLKAVKLTNATAAYWRGDSNNKSLQRVYGIAFPKTAELEDYLERVEEAKKRDHNIIGRQLGYFTTVDYIGQGLPILLPNGARVIQQLARFVEDEEERRGYLLTKTPFLAKSDLYKISGHWDHYRDGMFVLGEEEEGKEAFALRPMTCPFQFQVYLNKKRSLMALVLLGVIILLVEFYPKNLKVNFIDVGQGDATFIVTPYNNTILIDGGGSESKNYNIGKNTVLPYILDKGYTKIDYIIISHFDQDHVRWIVIYYARNKSK